eukprot:CAMPEP_0170472186 /NCGR_PEP_ID=MMETSP0123-20130129/14259_1 /TAXON_ID=182087 /ORGANISM="Favella ehrenbergii, Strain Fehren 1" /LENGTH=72 /DNA_ID=CAMNT_0010740289 /DNA_START=88 /DNA_END=306 /DNA_ORIENTATION=+
MNFVLHIDNSGIIESDDGFFENINGVDVGEPISAAILDLKEALQGTGYGEATHQQNLARVDLSDSRHLPRPL